MTHKQNPLGSYIYNMLEEGKGREQIEAILVEKGHDERFVREMVGETMKLRYASRRSHGLLLILAGAGVCLISCVLTINTSFSHGSFPYVLYGLTTVGILLAFAGFMRVF